MINVLQKTCLEAQRCQVKLNKDCDRQLILKNKCEVHIKHFIVYQQYVEISLEHQSNIQNVHFWRKGE